MKLTYKMQKGGNFSPYFATYESIIQPRKSSGSDGRSAQQSSSKDKDDSEKGKLTEKDLFSKLDGLDALPNELNAVATQLTRLYNSPGLSSSPLGNSIASLYAKSIVNIKTANFNKKEYDNALKIVTQNDGLNEFAINPQGKLVVYNKDKELQQISVQEYLKNQSEYQPLTNSNVMWLRAHDPQFAWNNQVFDIVTNGIGINKVHELIKNRLGTLGSTENSIEGYTSRESGQIKKGIQVLDELASKQIEAGMTVDGLYKAKVITKDQKQQADAALKYIYQTLPENAKAILQLHSGNKENPTQGALELIGNLIVSNLHPSTTISLNYQSELNADGTKRKSSKSGDGDDDDDSKDVYNTASLLLMGKGQSTMQVINPGTDLAFTCLASQMPLVNSEGKPIGKNNSLATLTTSQYSPILDFDHATMGGAKISDMWYDSVIINSDKISVLDFPVDQDGNPDLRPATIEAKRKADSLIKQAGININDENSIAQNADKINQILQSVGLNAAYNSQGQIIAGNWKRFAMLNATADSRALGMDDMDYNAQLLEITDDNQIDQMIELIKSGSSRDKYQFDKNEWYDWNGHDSFYQGTLWIPLNENYFMAQSGSGQKMKMQQIHDINKWEEKQYVKSNYVKPPTL